MWNNLGSETVENLPLRFAFLYLFLQVRLDSSPASGLYRKSTANTMTLLPTKRENIMKTTASTLSTSKNWREVWKYTRWQSPLSWYLLTKKILRSTSLTLETTEGECNFWLACNEGHLGIIKISFNVWLLLESQCSFQAAGSQDSHIFLHAAQSNDLRCHKHAERK